MTARPELSFAAASGLKPETSQRRAHRAPLQPRNWKFLRTSCPKPLQAYNAGMLLKKIRYHLSPKPQLLPGCTMSSARSIGGKEQESLQQRIRELGPWFHNYELASGVFTNPDHSGPGSDYPARRWKHVEPLLPDVRGKRCLDVGCSSGFFSLKLKELGASYVLGVDFGEQVRAMDQARFAAATLGLEVEFRPMSVYDAAQIADAFDLVASRHAGKAVLLP